MVHRSLRSIGINGPAFLALMVVASVLGMSPSQAGSASLEEVAVTVSSYPLPALSSQGEWKSPPKKVFECVEQQAPSASKKGMHFVKHSLKMLAVQGSPEETEEQVRQIVSKCYGDNFGAEVRRQLVDSQPLSAQEVEGEPLRRKMQPNQLTSTVSLNFSTAYSDLNATEKRMRALVDRYPDLVKLFVVGKSVLGVDILAIRVGRWSVDSTPDSGKQAFVFVGTHHAREWISTEIVSAMPELILSLVGKSSRMTQLINSTYLWFMPVQNPDGYKFTWEPGRSETGDTKRMWRKNRHPISGTTAVGVDPNRNYPYQWGTTSDPLSADPTSETYLGPSPASESEVSSVMDFLRNTLLIPKNSLAGFISYHSFGNYLLRPFGYDTSVRSPVDAFLGSLGAEMVRLMSLVPNGKVYDNINAAQMYPVNGDCVDWVHATFDYLPSYTVEARPDDFGCCGFDLPTNQIPQTVSENLIAALLMVDYLVQHPGPAPGRGIERTWNKNYTAADADGDGVFDYFQDDLSCGCWSYSLWCMATNDAVVQGDVQRIGATETLEGLARTLLNSSKVYGVNVNLNVDEARQHCGVLRISNSIVAWRTLQLQQTTSRRFPSNEAFDVIAGETTTKTAHGADLVLNFRVLASPWSTSVANTPFPGVNGSARVTLSPPQTSGTTEFTQLWLIGLLVLVAIM